MIWQDFMFACSMYQANDVFLASVAEEVKHQVIKQDDLFTHCGVSNLKMSHSFHFSFLVFCHFWQRSYENMKILHNLCFHFARQDGQDGKKPE